MPEIDSKSLEAIEHAVFTIAAVLRSLRGGPSPMTKEESERKARLIEGSRCLGCGELLASQPGKPRRGLHASCYHQFHLKKKSNPLLDDELVARGRLLPAEGGGRKAKETEFSKFLEENDFMPVVLDPALKTVLPVNDDKPSEFGPVSGDTLPSENSEKPRKSGPKGRK